MKALLPAALSLLILGLVILTVVVCAEDSPPPTRNEATPDTTSVDLESPTDTRSSSDGKVISSTRACPRFAAGKTAGLVSTAAINEASGLAASRRNAGVLWVHNDSGDGPRLFAIDLRGSLLGTYTIATIKARDWEDVAVGPGPTPKEHYLYVGDIGDNARSRPAIVIHRILEPAVDTSTPASADILLTGVDSFVVKYPDGAHDAETLLVDPVGAHKGQVIIVTKNGSGKSQVFATALPAKPTAKPLTLKRIASLAFNQGDLLRGGTLTTGGDFSIRGDLIVIRTYATAFIWERPAGASVADALSRKPCTIKLRVEPQGEAIAFSRDERGIYTLSEFSNQPLLYYARH